MNEVKQTSSGISVTRFDADTVKHAILVHDKCSSFQQELDRKDARIRALKAWLWYLAISFGAAMMLMGAALLAYFESIYVGP